MSAPPPAELRSAPAFKVVEWFSIAIYSPPLSLLRDRLRSLPDELRVPMLIIDFDTEVMMQGILGFLENSTGLYLFETIEALETVGAEKAAGALRTVAAIMNDCGVTVEQLRENVESGELYEITTFIKTHGEAMRPMARRIDQATRGVLDADDVRDLLATYLEGRRDALFAALERAWRND